MLLNKVFRVLILVLLLFAASWVDAQHKISGTITALLNNEALIGATIEQVGADNGTITDIDGKYTMTLSSPDASVIVKYIGYEDITVAVNGRSVIDVSMSESSVLMVYRKKAILPVQ